MKLLIIDGYDYAVINFENKYKGTKVIDIINDLNTYKLTDEEFETEDELWEVYVKEVDCPIPSDDFIEFVKDQMDYDRSKDKMWYTENETI